VVTHRDERDTPSRRSSQALEVELMSSLRASPLFTLVVLATLGLVGLIGVVLVEPSLIAGLLGPETASRISGHFREPHHRVHDLTFGFVFGSAAVGMLVQLWKPSRNVAGQVMALIPWVALMLAFVLAGTPLPFAAAPILAAFTLLAAILHPAGRDFFRSFRVSRVDRVLLTLTIIAAVPLVGFAATNIGLQRTLTDDHASLGHYGFMAAFSITVIGVSLLASLRPDGWRLTAWVGGLLPTLLALVSLIFPDVVSSLYLDWALAAIAWGLGFVAAAELSRTCRLPMQAGPWGVASQRAPHKAIRREAQD
jgi:hypothetical protein